MPKRSDISSVMIIGAGPIVIGQACEFDYSGTQACKALQEEGIRVVLVNSNPATIMTDPEVADATYIEPLTVDSLERIIAQERPDALLSTVGGQTALNKGIELYQKGVLEKYGVRMIGAKPEVINKAENNELFNMAMAKNGLEVPRNVTVGSLEEAMEHLDSIGLPAIIRPSFTLGGAGGGIARSKEEFKSIVSHGLDLSPITQVQIDESLLGWKEYEMEVIRDMNDNAIIVCSIENLDPMGVHTGDSITVAPALTLTDKEYQVMRNASIAVLREIGVETGGSNVQFAINPENGRMVVIEMNPRVSRSSALASKATGFPIAKVAAKLAVGYTLDEIQNDITKVTPASFEPSIDYVVTKIPRFNFEKFNEAQPVLSSAMRSVGEVMAIGRSFAESLQKGICSLEMGHNGLSSVHIDGLNEAESLPEKQSILRKALEPLRPDRIFRVSEAFRHGITVDEAYKITGIDPWFLREIFKIVTLEKEVIEGGLPRDKKGMLRLKKAGLSDARLAHLANSTPGEVRALRHSLEVRPVFKTVDTCAAEFKANTAYLYSCYEGNSVLPTECESNPSDRKKVIILGSGPNRIGQGIEFDYTCVHAAKCLSKEGFETIMVNCNPETVSTDYDTSDKLYFEPLQQEYVLELIRREQDNGQLMGVIVQFGGQTPLKLSQDLKSAGIPILGTSPDSIDLAENRGRFQRLLQDLNLKQPKNSICYDIKDIAADIVNTVGYPVVVRPSNVLGGRAMAILKNENDLEKYIRNNFPSLSKRAHMLRRFMEGHLQKDEEALEDFYALVEGPILLDHFLENAIEMDVDAICDGEEVYISGIMEHIERAGIHSGDSACVLPPYSLSEALLQEVRDSSIKLAKALNTVGPINIQYAVQNEKLYVIEVNPRASRTIPFVAKTTGVPVAKLASLVMVGKKLKDFNLPQKAPPHFAVKEAVLPFTRFPKADILLGPEMKSTGESMGHARDLNEAFAKAQNAAFNELPGPEKRGFAIVACPPHEQAQAASANSRLQELGFTVLNAGRELQGHLRENNATLLEFLQSGKVTLVAVTDTDPGLKQLRRESAMNRIPHFTTHEALTHGLNALFHCNPADFTARKLQDFATPV